MELGESQLRNCFNFGLLICPIINSMIIVGGRQFLAFDLLSPLSFIILSLSSHTHTLLSLSPLSLSPSLSLSLSLSLSMIMSFENLSTKNINSSKQRPLSLVFISQGRLMTDFNFFSSIFRPGLNVLCWIF